MSGILEGFTVIGTIIAVGYVVGRLGVLGPEARTVLSRTAILVATPCLLFTTLAQTDLPAVFSVALVVTVVTCTVVASLYVLTAVLRRRPLGESVVGAMASSYVNAGNLGIPIALYVFGDASIVTPVLLFQLAVMAPVFTTVLDLAAAREQVTGARSLLRTATAPLRNPITIGSVAGLTVSATGWQVPGAIGAPVELIGALAIPAILLSFGISLHGFQRPGQGGIGASLWTIVALKSVVHPVLAYLVGVLLLDLDGVSLLAVVVTAGLPTAQNVFGYAVRYDQGVLLARDATLVTTILSVPVLLVSTLLLA
ncbi:MAG: AEC family transporter [Nocardioidaceae bacterium]|nr:AEC family transporter [Nocardioidaceae bacterium]